MLWLRPASLFWWERVAARRKLLHSSPQHLIPENNTVPVLRGSRGAFSASTVDICWAHTDFPSVRIPSISHCLRRKPQAKRHRCESRKQAGRHWNGKGPRDDGGPSTMCCRHSVLKAEACLCARSSPGCHLHSHLIEILFFFQSCEILQRNSNKLL